MVFVVIVVVVVSLNLRMFGIKLGIVFIFVMKIVYDLMRSKGISGIYKGFGVILVRYIWMLYW